MHFETTLRLDGRAPKAPEKVAKQKTAAPPAIARAVAKPKQSAKQIAVDEALASRLALVANQRDRFRNRLRDDPSLDPRNTSSRT
jgi:hypothetical protein